MARQHRSLSRQSIEDGLENMLLEGDRDRRRWGGTDTATAGAVEPLHVLIVDDHPDVRDVLRQLIGRAGDDLVCAGQASSGEEALEAWRDVEPDAIVLDYLLPGMDGIATARALRDEGFQGSIVLCTGYPTDRIPGGLSGAGIDHVARKHRLRDVVQLLADIACAAGDGRR